MPTVAILPVKSFRLGKGRLAEELTPGQRSTLGQRLTEHVAGLTLEAGMLPVLIAGDAEVAEWAMGQGLPSIPDPGEGLNAAAAAGVDWAEASASPWLVLHTDLPLLLADDLAVLGAAIGRSNGVLAPSADGGTTAIGGRGRARFSYGPGSFRHHLGRFPTFEIVVRIGLAHDVDSVADLASARRHRRGRWLDEPA